MEHLIANSGIQFIIREAAFNPSQPLLLKNNRPLKYHFCDTRDFLTEADVFDIVVYHPTTQKYIPYDELKQTDGFERKPNGLEDIDEAGLQSVRPDLSPSLYTTYSDTDGEIVSISSLGGLKVRDADTRAIHFGYELLLGCWLPMPFFEKRQDGATMGLPTGWCRVKIEQIGEADDNGIARYRFTWAFDTKLSEDPLKVLRPYFYEDEGDSKQFGLSTHIDELLPFMSFNKNDFTAFNDYISGILNQGLPADGHRYIAYYIYLVNFIRLIGAAPEVRLHNSGRTIPVDFVLDIGNSRTCGVLFENGDFTRAVMLELRDLTKPHLVYDTSFDMRLVFRQADFGNDIVLEEDMFSWSSMVRVGQEAKNLVYRSLEEEGLSEMATNYSSPKRYLWDNDAFEGKWEFLRTTEDPFYIQQAGNIYIPVLSDLFDQAGNYVGSDDGNGSFVVNEAKYSRSSLMTFVMVEILNHAVSQINSIKFRNKHGNIDCRRVLRSIIMTCPTAMPVKEQVKLRQCAQDAYSALGKCIDIPDIRIVPDIEALSNSDEYAEIETKTWNYDEATCCQLVYLYAELCQRYCGDTERFFRLKGRAAGRVGRNRELTIGSIDIGAGTTDVMVCKYTASETGEKKLCPKPRYWHRFYLAGDGILRRIIRNLVI